MRTSMLLTAVIALLLGCSSDQTTAPVTDITPHLGYFVTVNGSQTGDGSATNPWSLATALAQPGIVHPGDTIWIHGGTYKGNFVSKLTGTADAPVILRQFPGERATIDGRLDINGQYAYYWGFEVTYSDPKRVSVDSGSRPADLPRNMVTVFVTGPFNKIINLVIHDLGDGLFSGSPSEGLEIYGALVYNNGWIGPDRGNGHGLYLQNQFATKRVTDNVIFDNFSSGLKIGGSSASYELNFQVEGNASFLNGGPALGTYTWQTNAHVQGSPNMGNITFSKNSFYQIDGNDGSFGLGQAGSSVAIYPITVIDNIVQGGTEFNVFTSGTVRGNKFTSGPTPYNTNGQRLLLVRLPAGVSTTTFNWDNNSVAYAPSPIGPYFLSVNNVGVTYSTLPTWQQATGWDRSGLLTSSEFPGMDIILRPNQYEPGRATITVWNWSNGSSADVDVSSVLKVGDKYIVHHVFDFFGPPLAQGTYSGSPIQLPLRAYTPPIPIGMSAPPPSPGIRFNVFILQKA